MLDEGAEALDGRLVVRGARLLDHAGGFTPPTDLLIVDGVIAQMGDVARNAGAEFSAEGRWIMPGIVDCHAHLACFTDDTDEVLTLSPTRWALEVARVGRQLLELGITMVRDPGSVDAGIRDGFAAGAVGGPILKVSGLPLSQTGGHSDGYVPNLGLEAISGFLSPQRPDRGPYVVDGPDEIRKAVRVQARSGVDWIKICTTGGLLSTVRDHPEKSEFTRREIRVAMSEAKRAGLPVAVHAYGGSGLTEAVLSGARSIEHGTLLSPEQADLMAEHECTLVPTLVVVEQLASLAESGALSRSATERIQQVREISGRQIEIARRAGVRIAVGSDLVTQGRNLEELALLGDAGMPAREVLLAATRTGVELLGMSATHGQIAPGFVFDAIVVDADPMTLEPFRQPSAISAVFQAGRLVRGNVRPAHATPGGAS